VTLMWPVLLPCQINSEANGLSFAPGHAIAELCLGDCLEE
jgi:hypothetical protein